jgi:hypothetical protein
MKFHKREIKKGIYGELSKIQEELEEAYDSEDQGQDLMLLIELSDIVGACAGVANKYGMSLDQLAAFAKLRSEVAIAEQKSKKEYNYGTDCVRCATIYGAHSITPTDHCWAGTFKPRS